MKFTSMRLALGVIALVVLTLPAALPAHPSLYNVVGKVAKSPEIQTITIARAARSSRRPARREIAYQRTGVRRPGRAGRRSRHRPERDHRPGQRARHRRPGRPLYPAVPGRPCDGERAPGSPHGRDRHDQTSRAACPTSASRTIPTGASLPDDIQRTVIPNDGYVMTFIESNGLAENGWLNLRFMPGGYRRPAPPGIPMTEEEWLNWPMAQTGIQSHATCQGAPGLNTEANILAVQTNETDPFWNYVPWQNTSAGLGDEPEQWIPVVLAATGVDLSTLDTVDEVRAACEGRGWRVRARRQPVVPRGQRGRGCRRGRRRTAQRADRRARGPDRPLTTGRSVQAKSSRGKVVAMASGALDQAVTVKLRISQSLANRLRIPRTLDSLTRNFGDKGATLVTLVPGNTAANRLGRLDRAVDIVVQATSGTAVVAVEGKLRI